MPKKKTEDKKEEKETKVDEKIGEKTEAEIEKAKKEIAKKAKKLAEKIEIKDKKDIKAEVEASKKKRAEGVLFPLDDYVKYSAHLGTKAVTPHMRQFVYRRRADGIAVLNTTFIDQGLKEAAEFLKGFKAEDIFLACKREAGWPAVKKFSELTGMKVFTGRYPPGVMTNIKLENFIEPKVVVVCDPFPDKNAIEDALRVGIPVLSLCDSNNKIKDLDLIIPCNNKGKKSLGLVFWLLAREVLKQKGIIKSNEEFKTDLEQFAPD